MAQSFKNNGSLSDKFDDYEFSPEDENLWGKVHDELNASATQLGDKFDGYVYAPSDKVWDKVEKELHPKRKKRAVLWLFGKVAIVLIAWFFVNDIDFREDEKALVATPKSKQDVVLKTTKKQVNNSIEKAIDKGVFQNDKQKKEVVQTAIGNSPSVETFFDLKKGTENKEYNEINVPIFNKIGLSHVLEIITPSVNSVSLMDDKKVLSEGKRIRLGTRLTGLKGAKPESEYFGFVDEMSPGDTGVLSSPILVYDPLDQKIEFVEHPTSIQRVVREVNNGSPYSVSEKIGRVYGNPISFGFSVEKEINSKLSMVSGVDYSVIGYRFEDSFSRSSNRKGYESYLGAPVGLKYKLIDKERWGVYALGGAHMRLGIMASESLDYKIANDSEQYTLRESQSVPLPVISGLVGVGLEVKLTDRVQAFANSQGQYHVLKSADSYWSQNPNSIGFSFGLNYLL